MQPPSSGRRYEIGYEPDRRLVRVVAWGFWTLDTVDRYAADLTAAVERARRDAPTIAFLLDAAASVPQSQEIGPRFAATWNTLLPHPGDRAALVAGDSALVMRQLKRLFESERCRVFITVAQGEAWLARETGG